MLLRPDPHPQFHASRYSETILDLPLLNYLITLWQITRSSNDREEKNLSGEGRGGLRRKWINRKEPQLRWLTPPYTRIARKYIRIPVYAHTLWGVQFTQSNARRKGAGWKRVRVFRWWNVEVKTNGSWVFRNLLYLCYTYVESSAFVVFRVNRTRLLSPIFAETTQSSVRSWQGWTSSLHTRTSLLASR